jgi:glycine oxidase
VNAQRAPDVLVLGAGILGLACARALAADGLRVEVLEAGALTGDPGADEAGGVAGAASGAAAGMLAPLAEAPVAGPFFEACRASRDRWASWYLEVETAAGMEIGYDRSGTLLVALDEDQEAANGALVAAARVLGEPVVGMDLRELAQRVPAVSRHVRSVHLLPGEHRVDNVRAVRALAIAAQRAGVTLHGHHRVRRVTVAGDAVRIEGDGWQRQAARLVVAAGAWSGAIDGLPALPIRPVRGQMISVGEVDWPWHGVIRGADFYVVRRGQRVVAGATVEEAGFACHPTAAGIHHLTRQLTRLLPGLGELPLGAPWAGLRPGTPDDQPLLGPVAGQPQILIASGHYRNGILLAPWSAEVIAETVRSGALPARAAAFEPGRFAAGSVDRG